MLLLSIRRAAASHSRPLSGGSEETSRLSCRTLRLFIELAQQGERDPIRLREENDHRSNDARNGARIGEWTTSRLFEILNSRSHAR
jgi:hypothetical protein